MNRGINGWEFPCLDGTVNYFSSCFHLLRLRICCSSRASTPGWGPQPPQCHLLPRAGQAESSVPTHREDRGVHARPRAGWYTAHREQRNVHSAELCQTWVKGKVCEKAAEFPLIYFSLWAFIKSCQDLLQPIFSLLYQYFPTINKGSLFFFPLRPDRASCDQLSTRSGGRGTMAPAPALHAVLLSHSAHI